MKVGFCSSLVFWYNFRDNLREQNRKAMLALAQFDSNFWWALGAVLTILGIIFAVFLTDRK
jgi:hypothetical protein